LNPSAVPLSHPFNGYGPAIMLSCIQTFLGAPHAVKTFLVRFGLPLAFLLALPSVGSAAIPVVLSDANLATRCDSDSLRVLESGEVVVTNPGCAGVLTNPGGGLRFESGGQVLRCGFSRMQQESSGLVQLTAAGTCLKAGSGVHAALLDLQLGDGATTVTPGTQSTYTAVVRNFGPQSSNTSISLSLTGLRDVTLSSSLSGARSLGTSFQETLLIPAGGMVTYTIKGTVTGNVAPLVKLDAANSTQALTRSDLNSLSYPVNLVLTEIRDGKRYQLSCGATAVNVGAGGVTTVQNASCFDAITGTLGDKGAAQFTMPGQFPLGCGFTRLSYSDSEGILTLETSGNCFRGGTEVIGGDGFRNPSTCQEDSQGNVAISGGYYAGTAYCAASYQIAAGSVAVIQGADVTFVAGKAIRLLPGFHAQGGSRFQAAIGGNTAKAVQTVARPATEAGGSVVAPPAAGAPLRLFLEDLPAWLSARLGAEGVMTGEIHADAGGRRIVFATDAALLAEDTNGLADVYLFDATGGELRLISRGSDGAPANGPSGQPRIDGGGGYLVFTSAAGNLTEGDRNGVSDIFIHELASGRTERISVETPGQPVGDAANPVIASTQPEVLFDRVTLPGGVRHVFRGNYLWPAQGVEHLSYDLDEQDRPLDNHHPAVSADGRFLVYREDSQRACGIRLNDYRQGTTVLLDCPSALAAGDTAYNAEIAADGSSIRWLPAGAASREAAGAAVTIANPLLR
jgi:hypothetical protein